MSIWINIDKVEDQVAITYNYPITYNQIGYYYTGKTSPIWANSAKSATIFTNMTKGTSSTWGNQIKN